MHASPPALGRAAAVLTAALAACGLALLASCAGASNAEPAATPAPADTSAPEVVVVPEPSPPEATSAEPKEPATAKTVFYMNRPFKSDPQLVLTRVTKLPDGLKLDLMFTNREGADLTIKVAPAGDPNAMFVELLDGRRLEFKSAEGISIKPDHDEIEPGQKQHFSVTFEPLPEGETKFHVYEGEGAKNARPGDSQYWWVRNIRLE